LSATTTPVGGRLLWTPTYVNSLYQELHALRLEFATRHGPEQLGQHREAMLKSLTARLRRRFPGQFDNLTPDRLSQRLKRFGETDATRCWVLHVIPRTTPPPRGRKLLRTVRACLRAVQQLAAEWHGQPADPPPHPTQPANPTVAAPGVAASGVPAAALEPPRATLPAAGVGPAVPALPVRPLTANEQRFRQLYAGKRLGVFGGDARSSQVEKLTRLGMEVRWLSFSHGGFSGGGSGGRVPAETINAIHPDSLDILFIWTRCCSHSLERQVMKRAREVNRAAGRKAILILRGRTLNTDVLAQMALAHLPAARAG
jgi:hypothetical protein